MQAFKQRAQQQFGSGWVWLAVDRSDYDVAPKDPEALVIIALPNQVPRSTSCRSWGSALQSAFLVTAMS